jgi:carboxypeptidase PM20D1
MRKWLAAFGLIVLALALAVGVKTLATPSRQLAVAAAKPVAVDAAAASARLGAAVRFKTIASDRDVDANASEFLALHAHLQESFPKLHAALTREVIGKYGLLYTWTGSDAQAAPIALLAHQDVVPIAPGTDGDWQVPPFSGVDQDGFVWGRGAWDDKGNLMAILEAVELRVAAGFRPRQTIYLAFGQDEEQGGERGAKQIAQLLKERGVRLRWVIDEGLLITEGAVPGLDRPAALIGVAEKGFLTVRLTANATPGHSSMPPVEPGSSAIGMLGRALGRLESGQMPFVLGGVGRKSFEALAPEMNLTNRVLLSNLWLFAPLVESQLKQSPGANASFRTTTMPARPRTSFPAARPRSSTTACSRATAATPSSPTSCGRLPSRRSRSSASRRDRRRRAWRRSTAPAIVRSRAASPSCIPASSSLPAS